MNYNDKLVKLLTGRFSDIRFTKMNRMKDNQWRLVDHTGIMFVRFQDNIAQISFSEDFKEIFEEIEIE